MKRQFEGFALQGSRLADDPSRTYEEPKAVQALAPKDDSDFQEYDLIAGGGDGGSGSTTDFSTWSEEELRIFLDQRGEDFDDCLAFDALVQRAKECEANTGLAAIRKAIATATAPAAAVGAPANVEDEQEIDPLDAFMAEIETIETKKLPQGNKKARVEAVEEEDHVAEFLERRQQQQQKQKQQQSVYPSRGVDDGIAQGYNSDEEVYAAARAADEGDDGGDYFQDRDKKREIESLAAANHAEIEYEEFNKEFYEPVAELKALSPVEIAQRQQLAGIRVVGHNACAPIKSFSQCKFDSSLLKIIEKSGYIAPTPIQSQALPIILSGRDVVGVAKTGSGKTAAFVLPMMVHIIDQRELTRGEGPIALIAAPTRELAEQIHRETRKFSRSYKLNVCAAFGGLAKHQQIKEMKQGVEVAVCTPGRMIDLIKAKACTLKRTTYVVLDEADRMFDLGFEPQIRSLLGQTRPDRQTLLFSATMPRKVERLAADALTSPVRITVGVTGTANEDVKQIIEIFAEDDGKQRWLVDHIPGFVDEGEVLIFANQKNKVEFLSQKLENLGIAKVGAIHGDLPQASRMDILSSFKKGIFHVLVATDVAARGLDIKTLKTVVNYDAAKDIDTHVHRIGRTGRAGDKEGSAYTLLLRNETRAAGDLERCLVAAGQEVPEELHEMAMRDPRAGRGRGCGGGRSGRGRGGRGRVGGLSSGANSQPLRPLPPGGSGLGFGPNAIAQHQQPQQQQAPGGSTIAAIPPGFAPSHIDVHFGSVQVLQTQQKPLPPPPGPLPPNIIQKTAPGASLQQQQHRGPAAEAAATKHAAVGQRFQNTFVSSGTTGHSGGGEPRTEIVLPPSHHQSGGGGVSGGGVSLSGRPLPPPPVPVHQRPLYMQHNRPPFPHHHGNQERRPPTQQPNQQQQSAEIAEAIARAKEIAARLTAQKHNPPPL
jgi:ATP-dependent RNA helicase DDX42